MILNIRGCNGSGKTHLARRLMERMGQRVSIERPGFAKPLGYRFAPAPGRTISVMGHYEVMSGGADRLCAVLPMEEVFALIATEDAAGADVLYEGINIGHDVVRTARMHHRGVQLVVIFLTTAWETCLESILARRAANGGADKPFDPTRSRREWSDMDRYRRRLREQGVRALSFDREQAYAEACTLLRLA